MSSNMALRPGAPSSASLSRTRTFCLGDDVRLARFLTVDETAALLRTTRKAVYAMVERRQLPGVTRIGRRILIHTADLLDWLRQKRTPSPKG
jgi:excisionase family DNA binding protein